jgi:hypothetical protein
MSKLYAYTTDTYAKKNWIKIGQTTLDDIEARVQQQDSTSNPEALITLQTWDNLPDHVTDHVVHRDLESKGIKPTRIDKSREWYECTIDDVRRSINDVSYGVAKPNSYPPRDEQQACVDQATEYFKSGGTEFLMNAKMRYGKTFTSYLIAKAMGYKSILVLTYKPAVISGWKEDLEQHVYFNNYSFVAREYSKDANVMFASFQDINEFDRKDKWDGITDHHFDMVILDEMHYGTTTARAQRTLSELNYDKTLFVSGTPLKALLSGKFSDDNTFTWSYADEQKKRKAEKTSEWATDIYRWLPPMEIHTFDVCDEAKENLKPYTEDEGFTMTKMFSTNPDGTFIDEASVKLFLDQVFGRGVRKSKSPFRTTAADHSYWVLPTNVASAEALANLLIKTVGDEYHIINASGDKISQIDKAKKLIGYHDKTITLSCGRFNTGVTVPEWDAVLMLNDTKAPETYFQSIFRAQSPDKSRRKELCTVFDFNPERTMAMVYGQAEIESTKNKCIEACVREYLEFAPIIDHSGNSLKKVDAEEIIGFVTEAGSFVDKFESAYLFNSDLNLEELSEVEDLLVIDGRVKGPSIKSSLNSNGLDPAKNFINDKKKKNSNKSQASLEAKIKKEYLEKAKYVTKHIPEFIQFVHNSTNVAGLLESDPKKFIEHFGISIDTFKAMIKAGFIIEDRLNKLITGLTNSYEHKLRAIEYARDGMFISEDLFEEMLNKTKINKSDSILIMESYGVLPMCNKRGFTNVTLMIDDSRESIYNIAKAYNAKVVGKDDDMKKFDVVIGNPPFSMVNKSTGKGRGIDLYPGFYEKSVKSADTVIMIMPSTHDRVFKKHNDFLKETANIIEHIDPKAFPTVARDMWYVIKNNSNLKPTNINWVFADGPGNDINFDKGKINITADSAILNRDTYEENDITIYRKLTGKKGLEKLYCKPNEIKTCKLFPKQGFAVLMPQQISKDGFKAVELVECSGKEAATNGMNIAFFDTKEAATSFMNYTKTKEFIKEAYKYVGGMGNMTKTAMQSIKFKL